MIGKAVCLHAIAAQVALIHLDPTFLHQLVGNDESNLAILKPINPINLFICNPKLRWKNQDLSGFDCFLWQHVHRKAVEKSKLALPRI